MTQHGFLGAAIALTALGLVGAALSQEVRREHAPGREDVIPHVSGDMKFTGTYELWKDEDAVRRSKAKGLLSHEFNFKDFRWLDKSFDGELLLDEGKGLFHQKDAQGRSCAGCHGENGAKLAGAHAKFPKFNDRLGRVVVVPTQIKSCAEERMGRTDLHEETRANTMLAYYIGYLSDGQPINIDVTSPGPLRDSYERGKELFFRRVGNFHFACANCHTPPTAGSYLRGHRPTTFFGDAASYPIYHFPYALANEDRGFVFTLQHQIKSCQILSRMYPGKEGSKSMTDIEVFLTAAANGYKVSIPVTEYNMTTDYLPPATQ
jgi:L-cysteine S-thiosulfotransferase